ncbi:MAG: caspase family protein [Paracoccaceae bacterium]
MAVPSFAEVRAAFVVGNSSYELAPELENPRNDARLVASTLERLGFKVDLHFDLTRDDFSDRFSQFLKENQDADVTFFYYAGHGMQFEGKNYLLGTDASLRTELDVASETVALDKVVELLEKRSKAALVFIDACRDNPLADDFYRRNFSATRALATRGLAVVNRAYEGAMLVFAASPGQVAYDGTSGNSPFTAALAKHLPTENIEVLTLMKRVIRDTKSNTRGQQTPIVLNDLTREIFLREAALRSQEIEPSKLEDERFEAAKEMATTHGWARYFELHPNGRNHQAALRLEHDVLLREVARLSAGWHFIAPNVSVTSGLAQQFETMLGLTQNDALAVQIQLRRAGLYNGSLDASFGPATRSGIRKFQSNRGLFETGVADRPTLEALDVRMPRISNQPVFSSFTAQRYDPELAAALRFEPRLIQTLEKLAGQRLIYGYREDRLYVATTSRLGFGWFAFDQSEGMHLVAIDSADENRYVYDLVRRDRAFWRSSRERDKFFGPHIGLQQSRNAREPSGGWTWVTQPDTGFRHWDRGEPNNHNGNEDFVALVIPSSMEGGRVDLQSGARWNDMTASGMGFVVEVE